MQTTKKYYIYRQICEGVVFYIGCSKNKRRLGDKDKRARSIEWHSFVSGRKFYSEIIMDNLNKEDAHKKEIEFISLYKRICDGGTLVNKSTGGHGAKGLVRGPMTDAHKEKISNHHTGKKLHPDTIKKMLESRRVGYSYKGKLVLNLYTGIFYDSIKAAANSADINYSTFKGGFKNNNAFINV